VGRATDLVTDGQLPGDAASRCCVSIYLPTHRRGRGVNEDRIRLKNLLAGAVGELSSLDRSALECPLPVDLLGPAQALLDDPGFWAHGEEGLAVLVEPHGTTALRMLEPVAELAVVADRFHLKPLLRELSLTIDFHILAISHKHVRLLHANRTEAREVAVDEMPTGAADVLQWDDRDRQLRSHGAGRVGAGRVAAAFHGHGGTKDARTSDDERYLQAVDRAVVGYLGPSAGPLVLAGVGELVADYQRISRYPAIVAEPIIGNPDESTAAALHERAWRLVEQLPDRSMAIEREHFLSGRHPTVAVVADAVNAAVHGRVSAIFVPSDCECWGRHDPAQGSSVRHELRRPGDVDLFDVAATETMRHHGTAFVVPAEEIPGDGEVAAVLRF